MKEKKSKHTNPLEPNQAESPFSNPAIVGLMADTEKNWRRESVKRDAWLKENEPPFVYGPNNFCSREYEELHHDELELHRHTYNALQNGLPFTPRNITSWRDYAVQAAANSVYEGLRHLQYLISKNDRNALISIADIATDATETLGKITSREVQRVRPIARHRFFWPFLKASKERFGDKHKSIAKKIQLGKFAPFSKAALDRIRKSNNSIKTAMTYLCQLEAYREPPSYFGLNVNAEWQRLAMKLKPFSRKTWDKWFDVAWQAVLADYKGHPERNVKLRKIGNYRAEHTFVKTEQQKKTSRTREANIQDGIKEKLRSAIMRLAGVKKSKKLKK
jgi:hypothetical protein